MTQQGERFERPPARRRAQAYRKFLAATTTSTLVLGCAATGVLFTALPSQAKGDKLVVEGSETSTDTATLLAPVDGKSAQSSAKKSTSKGKDRTSELAVQDPNEQVVTIVQLDDTLSAAQRDSVTDAIIADIKASAKAKGLSTKAIKVVQTYENAFHGVAIEMPRFGQEIAAESSGVATSFVEQRYEIPTTIPTTPLDTEGYELKNESSLVMTGVEQSLEKGDGMLISIIDTGLETTHEGFVDTLDTSKIRYTEAQIDALRAQLGQGASGTFVNNKVPFAYDYADNDNNVNPTEGADLDHGTHVAGIAAANGGETIRGAAPNAQVMVQKVFSDTDEFAADSWILAALDDAMKIKPDVINMSLGSSAGFTDSSQSLYGSIFEQLRQAGVVLSVSAGNSQQAAVNNTSGKNLPYVTDPDYGIVGSPSTYSPNLSIASTNNALARPYLLGGNGDKAYFKAITSADNSIPAFTELHEGDHAYVVAGLGKPTDIAEAMSTVPADQRANTILIINRGELSFQDKVNNAAAFGPAAVLIADNVESNEFLNPAIDYATMPVAVITKAMGAALAAATTKTLSVSSTYVDAPDQNFRASAFSSMGVTPELQLKPDVAAPGGNIYSAVPGGYDWMSGTSMAAPQVAGILGIVKEHILNNPDVYGNLSSVQAGDLAQTLIVNTATPLVNPDSAGKTYYTPRKQGAGLTSVPGAQRTTVSLAVKGAADPTRPTASLGESKRGSYSFKFVAKNFGKESQTYKLDATALSDTISGGLFLEESTDYTGKGISVSFDGKNVRKGVLTIPAGKSATVTVSIKTDKRFANAVKQAVNGTYIDGFVRLVSEDAPTLGIPFLGFYGDWSKAPVFDANLASEQEHISGTFLYNTTFGTILGVNPLDPNGINNAFGNPAETIKTDRYVVSAAQAGGEPSQFMTYTGMVRNAESLKYSLESARGGKSVASHTYLQVPKSYYFSNAGFITSAEDNFETMPLFSAYDSKGNALKAGQYRLVQTAKTSGPGATTHSQSFPISVDLTAPALASATVTGTGADRALTLTIKDDTFLAGLSFHEDATVGSFASTLTTDAKYTKAKGSNVYTISIPVSALTAAWQRVNGADSQLPGQITMFAWDYGVNRTVPLTVNTGQLINP
ncbi:S8 family serine peptidase [Timonella senegalensis]|uniref:S8 family serine peptidase n=1 Tax=Timonella senegalensis TaxID=1465825 RepID=UPI0028B183B1|nr:S8 family serine peptidase [Timonella senegalensis]